MIPCKVCGQPLKLHSFTPNGLIMAGCPGLPMPELKKYAVTADDAHKKLKWFLEQVANFADDHDVFLPKLYVEYRGLRIGLTMERVAAAPDKNDETPK